MVAACGSGKTRIGAEAAAELVPGDGRLLFTAPSVELLAQILREHRGGRRRPGLEIAVTADRRALASLDGDPRLERAEITTDPALLAALLRPPGAATVACTYQSLGVLREAHARHGLAPWSLIVVDEAHRTAGARGKPWAAIHDDDAIPAGRRLYLTATPRMLADADDEPAVSMDDEAVFGPVAYRLPFAAAIERGLLADYRVAVPVITHAEVLRIVEARGEATQLDAGCGAVDPALLAVQVALLRSAAQHGIRRAITYHNRVAEAAAFAETLPAAAGLLLPGERPERLTALHVEARQSAHRRAAALHTLGSRDAGLVVVSNAGLLAEGVDVPAVDAVAFLSARDSPEAVAQAVGRALRTGGAPDKVATIIIPVPLGPGHTPESALETSAYAPVWRTVRALRAHDERLAEHVDAVRFARGRAVYEPSPPRLALPRWLKISGAPVPEGFADAITLRMVCESTPAWEEWYGRAAAHHARHGHLNPDFAAEPELCRWLTRQRQLRRRCALAPEWIARLDALGMAWTPREGTWDRALQIARSYHQAHGNLNVLGAETVWGNPPFRLGTWVTKARQLRKRGELSDEQIAALDALGLDWDPYQDAWERWLALARSYFDAHGDLDAPVGVEWGDPPARLWVWLGTQRRYRDLGKLSERQIAALDALGMRWDSARAESFEQGLRIARAYHGEHGRLDIGNKSCWGDPPYPLGPWLGRQRLARRNGTLADEHIAALDALGICWNPNDETWARRIEQLVDHLRRHGAEPGKKPGEKVLYTWLYTQRRLHGRGALKPERAAELEKVLGEGWRLGQRQPHPAQPDAPRSSLEQPGRRLLDARTPQRGGGA